MGLQGDYNPISAKNSDVINTSDFHSDTAGWGESGSEPVVGQEKNDLGTRQSVGKPQAVPYGTGGIVSQICGDKHPVKHGRIWLGSSYRTIHRYAGILRLSPCGCST